MKNESRPSPLSETTLKKAVSPERYAEVLAHLLHFREADPAEVVRRLGLSPEVWAQADAFWAGELEAGLRRQQRDLALRFSTGLARTRARLGKKSPALSAIGTLDAQTPAAASPAPVENDGSPPASATPVLPSFMGAAATPMVAPTPAAPTPMFAPPAVPPTPSYTAPPNPAARPRTMAIPAAAAAPEERNVFAEGVASNVALKSAIEHAEAVQGPRPAKPPVVGLTEPTQADQIAAIAQRLMPFGPPGGPPAAPCASPPAEPATPSAPRVDSPPALPLERHASLQVDLSLHPEKRAEILQRYGLTADQFARIEAAWQARLDQDSSLRATWDTACAQYRTWLLRTRPGG